TSFPVKIHAIHIVNQSWVFDMVYNLFKPFMNERMKSRIFFHGEDRDSLHKHIDPKYLPARYGGVHPDYPQREWFDWFRGDKKIVWELKMQGYETDESKDVKHEL
ncbi:hypothetical protein HHI36_003879, partial [Cryptolaemus montrouzieri]